MITSKITSLFQFIDFLLANKDNFKKYDEVLREVVQLKKKLRLLNPKENFKDRKRYTAIEAEFSVKMELLLNNVNYPIKTKVEELKICDFNNSLTVYSNNIKEIADFIEYATDEDEKIVSEYKEKYIKYRTENSCNYLENDFFNAFDEIIGELIDGFKDAEEPRLLDLLKSEKEIPLKEIIAKSSPFKSNIHTSVKNQTNDETPSLPFYGQKYICKEYALAYIFDLYSAGKQIPVDSIEGCYSKKQIVFDGNNLYGLDPNKDSFYRAVLNVSKNFDLNKVKDLEIISKRWEKAVSNISKNWQQTRRYLLDKQLLRE